MQSELISSHTAPSRPSPWVPGTFVISLDLELRWGTRDQDRPASASQLLNSRAVVRRLLDLFHASGIAATWAAVGFLFAESRDELSHFLPDPLPTYEQTRLNPYAEKIGLDEQDDPLHFAPSLIREIQACPHQEIGTHTFSHYYCLERGQTPAQFSADLQSARRIAEARGIELRSIVFPRNQVNPALLPVLSQHGITGFRGTAQSFLHDASSFARQRLPHKRALRLADAYLPLAGNDLADWPTEVAPGLYEMQASRYFRPYTSSLAGLARLALRRIKQAMKRAALAGRIYHIWFHPEDFGLYPTENLALFGEVLSYYQQLRDQYGMQSLSMAGVLNAVSQMDSHASLSPCLTLSA
jgi:peptidoglycan/xylan/chitin deacetylase (PgdA/CDA1 family)